MTANEKRDSSCERERENERKKEIERMTYTNTYNAEKCIFHANNAEKIRIMAPKMIK